MWLQHRWVILLVSFYIIVTLAFVVQSIPPLIPRIMNEFEISHAKAGLLMSFFFIPGIFLAIPAGMLVDRYGVRIVGSISIITIIFGSLITAMSGSFKMALFGRLILGIGGVILITTLPTLISQWFSFKEIGKALGIYGINMPFATIISFPVASMLMLSFGWRYPLYLDTGLVITSLILFVFIVKIGPFKEERIEGLNFKKTLKNLEIWKAGMIWALCFASILSFTTWSPTLFEKFKEMNPFEASLLPSILMFAAILSTPIYGFFSNRIGRERLIMLGSFLSMAVILVVIDHLFGVVLMSFVAILGILAFMMVPIILMMPPKILGPSLSGTGYGILTICLMLGMTIAPIFIGWIIDITKSSTLSFMGMALFSIIGAVIAFLISA